MFLNASKFLAWKAKKAKKFVANFFSLMSKLDNLGWKILDCDRCLVTRCWNKKWPNFLQNLPKNVATAVF